MNLYMFVELAFVAIAIIAGFAAWTTKNVLDLVVMVIAILGLIILLKP